MMNKELCFKIENINIYLEQTLVDYMDIPIFFLCKGGEQYFVALCTDIYELNYIVVELSILDVYNLLHGNIPMRNVILKQSEYWYIISGDDLYSDKVIKMGIDTLNEDLLPEKEAYFKILTRQIEIYVQVFDNEFFSDIYFHESDRKADLKNCISLQCDSLIENIIKVNALLDYTVKKTVDIKGFSYEVKTNNLNTREIIIKKSELTNCKFRLSEEYVNIIADAA